MHYSALLQGFRDYYAPNRNLTDYLWGCRCLLGSIFCPIGMSINVRIIYYQTLLYFICDILRSSHKPLWDKELRPYPFYALLRHFLAYLGHTLLTTLIRYRTPTQPPLKSERKPLWIKKLRPFFKIALFEPVELRHTRREIAVVSPYESSTYACVLRLF